MIAMFTGHISTEFIEACKTNRKKSLAAARARNLPPVVRERSTTFTEDPDLADIIQRHCNQNESLDIKDFRTIVCLVFFAAKSPWDPVTAM